MAGLRRNTETVSGAIWRIKSGSSIEGRAGHASYFCRGVTRRCVMLFYRRVTRHHGVFFTFFPASSPFPATRHVSYFFKCFINKCPHHTFSALISCFNADTHSQPAPIPPSSQSSLLPSQRSSSTSPAGSQTHPSMPRLF